MTKSDLFWFAARIFLGAVFTYAGFLKAVEPVENFQAVILEYELMPYAWARPIAYVMPWLELVFGVFMILGYVPRISGLVLASLSLSFILMIGMSYLKTGEIPENCGCFGEGGIHLTPLQVLILDSVNTVIGLKISRLKTHPFSI